MIVSQRCVANVRSARIAAVPRAAQPCLRRVQAASYEPEGSIGGVQVSDAFANALKDALNRQEDAGRSSGDNFDWSAQGPTGRRSPQEDISPVVEVVATALASARQTLNRLTAERTELDSLIVKEERQVQRLQFLLEKLQSDYAYFTTVERMMDERKQQR